jgi:methionyl-tRNA formyltransferase
MRLLLMADHVVGGQITAWLLERHAEDLALVVTTSDGPINASARAAGVQSIVFESEEQVRLEALRQEPPIDLGVLAWWPFLIRAPLLGLPRLGFVNTHPSLLPHNRGKHYNFWAIVEQAPFGVSLHMVTSEVDSGEIVAQRQIPYDWEDTGKTLYEKAGAAMLQLFKDSYAMLRSGDFPRRPMLPGEGSFHKASEIEAASAIVLDDNYTARALLNVLRARTFAPHPACWFAEDGKTYEVRVAITRREP